MRVAAYLRVSTEDQAKEGFSLEAQEARLAAWAVAQGWKDVVFYREEGKSARKTTVRPVYTRMMAEMDSWDLLLVVKMDRIHRNSKNFLQMMEEFQKRGKKFASVTESFDTSSAMGRFVMDIIQRIAQLESETIGERVFVGMEEKAKQGGGWLGGSAPSGYHLMKGRLEIDYPAANIVRSLFIVARHADTFGEVGRGLGLDRFQARRILTNPVYAGCMMWNGIVQHGTHAPIVSVEQFMEVQKRFRTGVEI